MKAKTWLAVALAALMAFPAALASERLCIRSGPMAALTDMDGREIVPPGVYSDLFELIPSERYAAGIETDSGLLYALIDGEGRRLTEPRYRMLYAVADVILCNENNAYGALEPDGSVCIAAEYTSLTTLNGRDFLAMRTDPYDDEPDMIWRLRPGTEPEALGLRTDDGLTVYHDGRIPWQNADTELYGYLDGTGEVAITDRFETATPFRFGMARVSIGGLYGLIDPSGAWLLEPEYTFIDWDEEILAAVNGNSEAILMPAKDHGEGTTVEAVNADVSVAGGCAVISGRDSVRIYTAAGELRYTAPAGVLVTAGSASDLILTEGEWGTASQSILHGVSTGVERYQHLIPLEEDRYVFVTVRAVGYYSAILGEMRRSVDYDSLRCGIIDASGRVLLEAQWQEIRFLAPGRYLLIGEEETALADGDGNILRKWSLVT